MHAAEIVQRAIDYMEEHLHDSLSLEEIGEAAAVSVPNLYRLFYAMTGHPVKEYIRKRRTSTAAGLLRLTGDPTIDIGFRCGFDSYRTFVKTFKRYAGMTPGMYRKADHIFSFERLKLNERETYWEEREIAERYPDVKVIRLQPCRGIGYLHTAACEDGLEEEALAQFRALLTESGIEIGQCKVLGWNVELSDSKRSYGYQLAAIGGEGTGTELNPERLGGQQALDPIGIPGGLYAVTWTPAGPPSAIVRAWDRLLSEWLPRSAFGLGSQGYMEEYQFFNGRMARMKLYLPVERGESKDTAIEIAERDPVRAMRFREEGVGCAARADEASREWVTRSGFAGDRRLEVYMRCSYGHSLDEHEFYELFLAPPEGYIPLPQDERRDGWVDGGLYACMTTSAYGSMSGVLEQIYRWLNASGEYVPDSMRSWYVHYLPAIDVEENRQAAVSFDRRLRATCCVPVQASE